VKKLFLVHGEIAASEAFGKHIHRQFGWEAILPKQGQRFDIDF
jgi:predicted metal-dependent RNase